jgi:hypothetical protein
MIKVQIGSVTVELNKNEVIEAARIKVFMPIDKAYSQSSADIWMRSAPSVTAMNRRKAAVRALGLSDEIKFL